MDIETFLIGIERQAKSGIRSRYSNKINQIKIEKKHIIEKRQQHFK
ncbi:MAG: hypothetical protein HFI90_10700 [Clostridia bacterium]|nr:hypothetical protein [Clostridia bacterium]